MKVSVVIVMIDITCRNLIAQLHRAGYGQGLWAPATNCLGTGGVMQVVSEQVSTPVDYHGTMVEYCPERETVVQSCLV